MIRAGVEHVLRLWFGLRVRVGRRSFVASGLFLASVKYGIDALLVYRASGQFWSPLSYLNPIYAMRMEGLTEPRLLAVSLAAVALPFLWIGVSMSVRRAIDAAWSPWLGTLFLVPIVNYAVILALSVLPSRFQEAQPIHMWEQQGGAPKRARASEMGGVHGALLGVLLAAGAGLATLAVSVHGLGDYGGVLFFAAPFAMGAISAFFYNRPHPRKLLPTLGVALTSLLLTGGVLLLFALEGLVCLLMAAPLALVPLLFGAVIGWVIATATPARASHTAGMLVLLPIGAGAEGGLSRAAANRDLYEVRTAVEIDAAPELVWQNVIAFSELDPPSEWEFKSGIAYPVRARLEGSGVGAVRHCEFSTGSFVEPITVWEPPRRLAFSVARQPPAMHELSPYRNVSPPHLESSLRSRRGEFRLIPSGAGRTRLEGSTWYELSITPSSYWRLWSDGLIHGIHRRVLEHIKHRSENLGPAPAPARR